MNNTIKQQLELPSGKGLYQYSNENFLGLIKDLANEIENESPCEEEGISQEIVEEKPQTEENSSNCGDVSTNDSSNEEKEEEVALPLNQCWIRTKTGSYKDYTIEVGASAVEFNRANSSKTKSLSYELNAFQCIQLTKSEMAFPYCLVLVASASKQREVFFQTQEAQKHWHNEILSAQGFSNNRIEQYKILKNLGEGSFGRVVLAEHKFTALKVAIKFVSKQTIEKSFTENDEKFQEIEIMEQLSSDDSNVLKLVESFENDEYFVAVTRFMNTGSLFDFIIKQKTQPLSEEQTKEVMRQVATGLRALHKRNIVHRDIKIDNVLVHTVNEQPQFFLADMGSGAMLSSADGPATFRIGT